MKVLFLSYRREDGSWTTQSLHDNYSPIVIEGVEIRAYTYYADGQVYPAIRVRPHQTEGSRSD